MALKTQRSDTGSERSFCKVVLIPEQRLRCAIRIKPACVTYQRPAWNWRSPAATERPYASVNSARLSRAILGIAPHAARACFMFERKALTNRLARFDRADRVFLTQ